MFLDSVSSQPTKVTLIPRPMSQLLNAFSHYKISLLLSLWVLITATSPSPFNPHVQWDLLSKDLSVLCGFSVLSSHLYNNPFINYSSLWVGRLFLDRALTDGTINIRSSLECNPGISLLKYLRNVQIYDVLGKWNTSKPRVQWHHENFNHHKYCHSLKCIWRAKKWKVNWL